MRGRALPAPIKSTKKGVLILECIDKPDPGSEGHFLSHMFNLMQVPSQYMEIRTKQQFLAMLGANPFGIVHITTHGSVDRRENFLGFWTPEGVVYPNDFAKSGLQGKTIVSTACRSGSAKFANPFVKQVLPKYYIAPRKSPYFHNAIFFAHWFYHSIFVLKRQPDTAVEKYRDGYKNPHDFMVLSRGHL